MEFRAVALLFAPRELATAFRSADHPTLVVTRRGLRVSWFAVDTGHRLLPVEAPI